MGVSASGPRNSGQADEATAEAIINVALQTVRDELARYDGGWTTRLELIGALCAATARAEHEALEAGWPFLYETARSSGGDGG